MTRVFVSWTRDGGGYGQGEVVGYVSTDKGIEAIVLSGNLENVPLNELNVTSTQK